MGIMFGGVTDEDTGEEGLESVFWNDMYGYQIGGKGRWISLALKQPKAAKAGGKKKAKQGGGVGGGGGRGKKGADSDEEWAAIEAKVCYRLAFAVACSLICVVSFQAAGLSLESPLEPEPEPEAPEPAPVEDPMSTIPMARYNTMLAVLRNTLYMYAYLPSWWIPTHPNL